MNREEIQTFLPHRGAMLLLDEVFLEDGNVAQGQYRVRGDEWFLDGHFPGNPIVPGVVLCEIIAQTASILMKDDLKGKTPLYAGMKDVRFRRMVKPGDLLTVTCRIERRKLNVFIISGEASVEGALCAGGLFTLMLAG